MYNIMKTLITLIATAVFTFLTSTLSAANMPDPLKFAKVETIIDHYINATVKGDTELLNYLFTEDFTQTTPNKQNKEKHNRKEVINHLKTLKNVEFSCDTDVEFIEKNDDCSIVKITKSFANFQRIDYVTMCNTEEGWKINKVLVAYPAR
ncbi:hypothetical protein GQF61_14575 [Sphingobacterium sp. DK4209]|uniref:Nuclear transport factor 2 family protein n=2 Tax=Sphingobacterium zhuxiongii TaxID=2662364 RepID=A0A5Q0QA81_9SPHI|nr:hypothetical protein [Sphingobacterium sp. DK4209]QGA26845.1 hypothetical protein GFH32_11175 [Sphingobacterium sp. dk4302]